MPESITLSQIHSRLPVGEWIISLQRSVVRDNGGVILSILFPITDASSPVNAECETKLNKSLLQMMHDKVGFQSFTDDSIADLHKAYTALRR